MSYRLLVDLCVLISHTDSIKRDLTNANQISVKDDHNAVMLTFRGLDKFS